MLCEAGSFTSNTPIFNVWHDSLIIVGSFALGFIPVVVVARTHPLATGEPLVSLSAVPVSILSVLSLLTMGIYQGYRHLKSPASRPLKTLHPRMVMQWSWIVILVLTGWAQAATLGLST
jgi:heme/copper-type cytochrome/quinol oxidase subunit 2